MLLVLRSLCMILSVESWWRYNSPRAIPLIISKRLVQSSNLLRVASNRFHFLKLAWELHFKLLPREKLRSINWVGVKIQTKNKVIQASVGHEFIDQHLFILLNRTTKKFYKITVLKCCRQLYFIFELLNSLSRCFRKPLNSDLLAIYQYALGIF